MAASHQIKAIPQSNTYWNSRKKLAGTKFGTALMATKTVLQHLQVYDLVHTRRKVTGNKSGTAVAAIRSVLGHLRFCVLLKSKVVG